ncbi:ATP-binding cassette subfamily B protein [Filimonas zeae]|uniref:Multidrug ABC transporter ATP-binding protein n=1 Tax=Filimonas zeae TaxID=1737353 RepID=A0A917J6E2_9BACT|nr:ABC transporter ATP-binding protein [Filimonas zeae]MDR6343001.1 ATP-binding cassette subfamily B protein [Filimonas zeae]GGH83559.1 multidrug ABC transporter ATP-binding protein [Filimonas zeae]
MNYNLNQLVQQKPKASTYAALKSLLQLIAHERRNLLLALATMLVNAGLNLLGPFLIGYAIDKYVVNKQYSGVLMVAGILLGMYLVSLFTSYYQTRLMGGVGQRMLFTLRNSIFNKLQVLPVAFFNANKAGDLISRVNNDTEKLNTFFSQSLTQFIGSIATMLGAGIFLLVLNTKLGLAALLPAVVIILFTRVVSPWVKKKNAANMNSVGGMSAEIQESLSNFKVIIAFNRRDYFRQRFQAANQANYTTARAAGLANNIFLPVYTMLSSLAQLIVLLYGIHLISVGEFSIGLLVSYMAYSVNFYNPLRQLASLWTSFQVALAGWDRISVMLALDSDMPVVAPQPAVASDAVVELQQVHFGYVAGKEILHNISMQLHKGKTYAFVGPTGGGKTTTASLIARLYDPVSGTVLLNGRDIRSYTAGERAQKIGFILQEPFLFTGTVKENIVYGNEAYRAYTNEQLEQVIQEAGLQNLLTLFESGLDTKVTSGSDGISLGQKQLIAFIRAVLRKPEVLILDEATANIDTVTEQLLEEILKRLPATTTRIIIAHRLNTIENADEIFFVNSGEVTRAGSFEDAVNKLLHGKRAS